MRTVDDLRAALIEETSDLQPDIQLAPIVRRARQRRLRQAGAAATAGLIVASAAALASLYVAPSVPEPLATPTVAVRVDPSFPPYGKVITTGARVGADQELVIWFGNGPDTVTIVSGLLNRRTGSVASLETISSFYSSQARTGGFQLLAQVDDRKGGVLDYGFFIGTPSRIVEQANGRTYQTSMARWSVNPAFVVFWVDHPGTPLPDPTAAPATPVPYDSNNPSAPDPLDSNYVSAPEPYDPSAPMPDNTPGATGVPIAPAPVDPNGTRFIAYDPAGKQLATSDGLTVRPADIWLKRLDAPQLGKSIDTGATLADGGQLVFWFVGSGDSALLKAGSRRAGTVTELKVVGSLHVPPFNSGFYRAWDDFDGPNGTHIMAGTYVGPATKVVTGAPGPGVRSGYGHWSSHPELIVYWAENISTANYPQTAAVAYDPAGKVVGAFSYGSR
jgi:hypothetical protein